MAFAPFQGQAFLLVLVFDVALSLHAEVTKSEEVVGVERCNEEEHRHFVGSYELEKL